MLISIGKILNEIKDFNITGALHIGAHDCQEDLFYKKNLKIDNIVWVDAMEAKVFQGKEKGHNIFHATISDTDDQDVKFNITNNEQSSSILDFGTHSIEHPDVVFVKSIIQKSKKIDTFLKNNNIDPSIYNFWNFDIQGAELLALKGATNAIKFAKVIYLEVNTKELYKGCALLETIDTFLKSYNFERKIIEMTRLWCYRS